MAIKTHLNSTARTAGRYPRGSNHKDHRAMILLMGAEIGSTNVQEASFCSVRYHRYRSENAQCQTHQNSAPGSFPRCVSRFRETTLSPDG